MDRLACVLTMMQCLLAKSDKLLFAKAVSLAQMTVRDAMIQ